MKDAKTLDVQEIVDAPSNPASGFTALETSLENGGPEAALERLIEDLETSKDYRLLLDALLLKARFELGLPLIQVGKYADLPEADRLRFEERYIQALRHVGTRYLEADDIPTAWAYFQAISEPGPVAEALDRLQPPKDPEQVGRLIEVAFHQGANPRRGFELILANYGACSAITSLEQVGPADPATRAACVERLIRYLHEQLTANIRNDVVQRGQPQSPQAASIVELLSDRDWLFSDESYHIDVSHLTTVVRWSVIVTDPKVLDLAIDLAEYGRRLSPRLQYDGTPPFEHVFDDHRIFLRAIRGYEADEAVAHFQAKLPAPETIADDVEATLPAQVLVNLLLRLDRGEAAVDVASQYLLQVPDSMLVCPPIAELCQMSGQLDRLADVANKMNHPVHFLAAKIQSKRKA